MENLEKMSQDYLQNQLVKLQDIRLRYIQLQRHFH
jgi:hypothetical protein